MERLNGSIAYIRIYFSPYIHVIWRRACTIGACVIATIPSKSIGDLLVHDKYAPLTESSNRTLLPSPFSIRPHKLSEIPIEALDLIQRCDGAHISVWTNDDDDCSLWTDTIRFIHLAAFLVRDISVVQKDSVKSLYEQLNIEVELKIPTLTSETSGSPAHRNGCLPLSCPSRLTAHHRCFLPSSHRSP